MKHLLILATIRYIEPGLNMLIFKICFFNNIRYVIFADDAILCGGGMKIYRNGFI